MAGRAPLRPPCTSQAVSCAQSLSGRLATTISSWTSRATAVQLPRPLGDGEHIAAATGTWIYLATRLAAATIQTHQFFCHTALGG